MAFVKRVSFVILFVIISIKDSSGKTLFKASRILIKGHGHNITASAKSTTDSHTHFQFIRGNKVHRHIAKSNDDLWHQVKILFTENGVMVEEDGRIVKIIEDFMPEKIYLINHSETVWEFCEDFDNGTEEQSYEIICPPQHCRKYYNNVESKREPPPDPESADTNTSVKDFSSPKNESNLQQESHVEKSWFTLDNKHASFFYRGVSLAATVFLIIMALTIYWISIERRKRRQLTYDQISRNEAALTGFSTL